MKRAGRPRRRALAALIPDDPGVLVDVGADHGHVASAVGAIATERMPGRIGRRDVPWVVADGLAPFRYVDTAVIAGMGAHTILGILDRGPRPRRALIVHAPDAPALLRRGLAERGWRIDHEMLAPEARRYAEVIRAIPGREPSTGAHLDLGPRLLVSDDPLLEAHLRVLCAHLSGLEAATRGRDVAKHATTRERLELVEATLRSRFPEAHEERSHDGE